MSIKPYQTIEVRRDDLKHESARALEKSLAISSESASEIINQFEYAELSGKRTHGFVRVPWLISQELGGDEPIVFERRGSDTDRISHIDCTRSIGYLALNQITDFVRDRAEQYGMHTAIIHNAFPTNTLGYYMRNLTAANGSTGILLGSTPKLSSAPRDQKRIIGTNPLAIGVHDANTQLITDITGAPSSFGEVLVAKYWGELQLEHYRTSTGGRPRSIDDLFEDGEFTGYIEQKDDQKGDRKVYAISLALQAMLSTLAGDRKGRGNMVMIAINAQTQEGNYLAPELIEGLKNEQLPGVMSHDRYNKALETPSIVIPEKLWNDICTTAR